MLQVLIVEDEKPISNLIRLSLTKEGYHCTCAFDGAAAADLLVDHHYDLILLDVMLPEIDGFELMEYIRPMKVPVIFLTAKSAVKDRVKGLKLGAEDYIVKPFEILELLVRMEKVLKRTGRSREKIQIQDVVIDLKEHSVTKAGEKVALKPMEYELLVTLAGSKNVAFSREELLNRIWGTDYVGETRTVDVHIGQLRKKLGFHDVIRTISKTGYRLEDLD